MNSTITKNIYLLAFLEVIVSSLSMIIDNPSHVPNALSAILILFILFSINLILIVWHKFFNVSIMKFILITMCLIPFLFYCITITYYSYFDNRYFKSMIFFVKKRKYEVYVDRRLRIFTISQLLGKDDNQSKRILSGRVSYKKDTLILIHAATNIKIFNDKITDTAVINDFCSNPH